MVSVKPCPPAAELGSLKACRVPLHLLCHHQHVIWLRAMFMLSDDAQSSREGNWKDELLVVHIARGKDKEKEKERWDHGSAVIADLETCLQPYKHDIYDLEVGGAVLTFFVHFGGQQTAAACTGSASSSQALAVLHKPAAFLVVMQQSVGRQSLSTSAWLANSSI